MSRAIVPYGAAVLAVALAALLRTALAPVLGSHYPLGTFYAAVALVGWFWGVRPAVLTALLGYVLGELVFLSPGGLEPRLHVLELSAYAVICAGLIAFVHRVFERQSQLEQALSARALAQRAVAEKDARFKQYLDAMPDIVYTWKADGLLEYVNPRWAEYTGVDSAAPSEVSTRIPASDLEALQALRGQAIRDRLPLRAEFRLRDQQGRARWFLTRCVPIRNADDSIGGWVGSSIDVDDEKRARDLLEFSERRYRSVSEAFDFGMWSADADGRLTFASPRLLEFLGLSLQEAQQRLWPALLAPDSDRDPVLWQACIANGQTWDWETSLTGADGTVRRVWSRGIPLQRADGATDSWAGFCLDVTERYAAESARDQARQRLEALTERMSVGVAQCNRQFEYVWANPAYALHVGWSAEQMPGRRIEDVLGAEIFETLRPYFERVLRGECVQYERPESIGGMPTRWIHVAYTPIWNGKEAPVGWVAVVNDLTERRELEEQLRAANAQKDRFLATLAHELRNPLAPIRYATRLLKPGVPIDMIADAGAMIDRQLAHMARLLDDLLDVSRITRGTLEIRQDTLDLRATLQQAVDTARPLAEAAQQRLGLETPDTALPVRGDETRLIQVMGNLINNAVKYTSPGGQIWVSAGISDGNTVVTVRDNGSGIALDFLPRVFDLFSQGERGSRSQSGLGIGLALAKQIVELHGGSIEAHSDGPARGSEFRVHLPAAAEIAAVDTSRGERLNIAVLGADSLRVLIVDDNADAAEALAQVLKMAGYQTHIAYDGRAAIDMAELLKPSVVLLDLGLPHLSGREVGQRLRAMPWGRAVHLIAITGWGGAEEVRRSRDAGFDQHLTKPVDPDVLLQLLIRLAPNSAAKAN